MVKVEKAPISGFKWITWITNTSTIFVFFYLQSPLPFYTFTSNKMGSSSSKQKHPTWGPGGNPSKAQQPGGFPPASSIAVAPVTHTGSAPMWNDKGSSRHNDFYRNNTQHLRTDGALNGQKMPPTAPFNVQYEHGKALDKRAERLDNDVKLYKATANPQGRMEKKRGNPDFRGNPPESHEWHDGAAERLDEAGRTWKA